MHLTTLKEGRERAELITIYKLMNNFEETYRKYLILRRKGEAKIWGNSWKYCIKEFAWKIQISTVFPKEL